VEELYWPIRLLTAAIGLLVVGRLVKSYRDNRGKRLVGIAAKLHRVQKFRVICIIVFLFSGGSSVLFPLLGLPHLGFVVLAAIALASVVAFGLATLLEGWIRGGPENLI